MSDGWTTFWIVVGLIFLGLVVLDGVLDHLAWRRDPQAYLEYRKWKYERDRKEEEEDER
jgi:hypothetical protein